MKSIVLIPLYLIAFISANLIVKHFGAYGLWFSSALLIPFDFVCRCIIHEKYKGARLIAILFALTVAAAGWTILINFDALNIALASCLGFAAAQVGAGIFYQSNKNKSWFFKVNISDLLAIIFDSIVFQYVAFWSIDPAVTAGQICIKFAGGLFWYYILFKKLKINEKINRS
jgi:uncharacterized PurR-regulated membrane protein YhhQ (DUF165 family)